MMTLISTFFGNIFKTDSAITERGIGIGLCLDLLVVYRCSAIGRLSVQTETNLSFANF